ncbi:DUF4397 domain-containing protein [Piscinibacter gummiphilus]|uniref:DUF4397 domain-containing protein n=1 Tax=Piscinibacter gummiphilus TaxID=946333 RepID=A0ABZ0CXB4_9BURK|nr:DUF4397 domain-containing protein [Piscinibacter gummiphilus]WOB09548.1 DUF4397 domain-containing protein [Piscinibacter gummiphilus]
MKTLHKILLACAPLMLVAACGGGDDSVDDRLSLADPKVRFVHAIEGGPAVGLYRDGGTIGGVNGVNYRFASNYFDVSSTAADYSVRTTAGNVQLSNVNLNPHQGDKYTFVAYAGTLGAPSTLLIEDPYNKSLTSNDARVRVVNGSNNTPNVDVYLTAPTVDINTVSPNFANVALGSAVPGTGADSHEFGANNYQLRITTAGTKNLVFNAPLSLSQNADLLLITVPSGVAAGQIKILAVTADSGVTAPELTTVP